MKPDKDPMGIGDFVIYVCLFLIIAAVFIA